MVCFIVHNNAKEELLLPLFHCDFNKQANKEHEMSISFKTGLNKG